MISDSSLDALFRIVVKRLATAELASAAVSENEAAFTRRAILPIVKGVLDEADVRGFLLGGQYTGINRPVRYLGASFHPDIAVLEHERRLLAIEVKFLGAADQSGLISKAIGQTAVYRLAGYKRAITLLLGRRQRVQAHHLRHAQGLSAGTGSLALVVRLPGAAGFRQGSIFYPTG